ncbi:unnamed protein product [Pleuronectes platessa]|uniref:Uncharacterized protein n=1 Tax=Pleuronectes platessa TaxID=8262 RepID=A0A9N7USJ8_PLEPL|nr:unnamed protein product [Pleuronectes platessa]
MFREPGVDMLLLRRQAGQDVNQQEEKWSEETKELVSTELGGRMGRRRREEPVESGYSSRSRTSTLYRTLKEASVPEWVIKPGGESVADEPKGSRARWMSPNPEPEKKGRQRMGRGESSPWV